jgi:hypothetical protein
MSPLKKHAAHAASSRRSFGSAGESLHDDRRDPSLRYQGTDVVASGFREAISCLEGIASGKDQERPRNDMAICSFCFELRYLPLW